MSTVSKVVVSPSKTPNLPLPRLTFSTAGARHSRGITVLVALCAALGTIFLIVFIGIIIHRIQRRRAGYTAIPNNHRDKSSNINRVPPETLFGSLAHRNGNGNPAPHV